MASAEDLLFEENLPVSAIAAIDQVKQIFGEKTGIVTEASELSDKIRGLQFQLKKNKNITRGTVEARNRVNLERSEKRKEIRRQIAELQDQMEALKTELNGKVKK